MTTALLTDNYELTMAQTYLQNGRWKERAVFDYFFRTLPFEGGYAVFAGLEDLVQNLQTFRFGPEELDYLKNTGYTDDFLAYLEKFEFCGDLYSPPEGEIIFPNAPILRIQGNLIEAQIIETILLNTLNFQTLIATKAARIKEVSDSALVSEFGFRRAPGLGGLAAARAAIIGGCDSTSNLEAGRRFRVPVAGTMAHSFVQTYSDELTAFRQFAKVHGSKTVLLLDTYNTLYSGLPNAISVAKELEKEGKRLAGVRLDSGDLAYLAKAVRTALDRENLNYVKIVASNQLDEYVIRSLYNQGAPIDFFGVGTSLATGLPDAALDGVYKLAETAGRPTMKFSEKLSKSTLPGCKTVWRLYDDDGMFTGDIIDLEGADFPKTMIHPFEPDRFRNVSRFRFEPLLKPVLKEGKLLNPLPDVLDAAAYKKERMEKLPVEHRRFENPHIYKVGISPALKNLRDELRVQYRQSK